MDEEMRVLKSPTGRHRKEEDIKDGRARENERERVERKIWRSRAKCSLVQLSHFIINVLWQTITQK